MRTMPKPSVQCRPWQRSTSTRRPGRKTFDTRAAKATDKIRGKGYSVIDDERLKVLPEPPPGAMFDAEEQAKYRAFKEARRGAADYMAMEGEFAKYLAGRLLRADPVEREALTDECDILVVGAGFAGLLLWHKLQRGRLRRRALLREGRRRRRHLVLEPLPGHRLRRRVVQLLPAAGGDGLRPDDEVRLGLRDPRVLPEDGRPSSASTTTACSTPRSSRPSGTRTPGAGPCTPTAATPCGPGS